MRARIQHFQATIQDQRFDELRPDYRVVNGFDGAIVDEWFKGGWRTKPLPFPLPLPYFRA